MSIEQQVEARPVYDKTGREIMLGDVLKVYHFQGARWRKHYYMYKQVTHEVLLGTNRRASYFFVSHMNMKDKAERDSGYYIHRNGDVHRHVEIVQGLDWYHDRPRIKLEPTPDDDAVGYFQCASNTDEIQ